VAAQKAFGAAMRVFQMPRSFLQLPKQALHTIYTKQHTSKYSRRQCCIKSLNIAGAFASPKGMTQYSNNPQGVQKAVFHLWPGAT
jgi:hypothetical protein